MRDFAEGLFEEEDPDAHLPEILELEFQATRDFSLFVFRTEELATETFRMFHENRCSVIHPPHGHVICNEARQFMGMYALVGRDALQRSRLQSAVVLDRGGLLTAERRALLALAGSTLLSPEPGDLYLTRIGVSENARGKGIGKKLLEAAIRSHRGHGYKRIVLDVSAGNLAGISYFSSFDFRETGRAEVENPRTGEVLAHVHMALSPI